MGSRDAERDARGLELSLRAHEPLRHRRLRDEERARDLLDLETAERRRSPRRPMRAASTRPHSSRKTCSRIAYASLSGWISIAPPRRAAGMRDASSIAASMSGASKKQ